MERPFLTTCLIALYCGLGTIAQAQISPHVDALAAVSQGVAPLRSFDPETRAANRLAIVIGNSAYQSVSTLPNAIADARAMTEFFRSQGYLVSHHEDITKREFENVLRQIMFDADAETEVVVFYAGHGFQIGNENYLVPVDAALDSIYDVPFESVSLGSLVGIVGARARMMIVMLDSCRDNPFAGRQALHSIGGDLREMRTGFTSQAAPLNSILVYSTAPGSVAFDGEGTNSPFTAAFIEKVSDTPDDLAKEVFEDVRRTVYTQTNGRQVPWDSSTLVEPASFGLGAALTRPIAVSSIGMGVDRGIARLGQRPGGSDEAETQVAAPFPGIRIEADLAGEVPLGEALLNAVDGAASLHILSGPQHGHLTLTDANGINHDVVGRDLGAADLARLVLVNRSVQIPAASLAAGAQIEDSFSIRVGADIVEVGLSLAPNDCDFEAGDHLDPDGMGLTRYPNEIRPEIALAACSAAVAAQPDVGRLHYQLGRAQLALRDFAAAEDSFTRARDLGHVRAWYALGQALHNRGRITGGLDRPRPSDEVLQLYARGSAEGDPYAMYTLGSALMNAGDTPDIEIEGYDLVMRSLEVGHTFAMNAMGQLYLDEESPYHDPARGLRYYTESAARGDIYGYNSLGLVYWQGRGGEAVDLPRAFDLFMRATQGGHPVAPYNLARMYRDGDVPGGADMAQAVEWLLVALDRGHAASAAHAAYAIRTADVPGYDLYDAAAIAARGAALLNSGGAADAAEQLDALDEQALNGGLQRLLQAMGHEITAVGDYGPATEAALLALVPAAAQADTPRDRLLLAATEYWRRSPFRVDLY